MSEKLSPAMSRHLHSLQRYMNALDKGDLDILAAILRQAEDDPALERILLAVNEAYQSADDPAPALAEIASAQQMIARLGQTSEDSQRAPLPTRAHFHMLSSYHNAEEKKMITNDPHPSTTRPARQTPERSRADKPRRRGARWLQSLAAVLVVGVLLGGFLFVFTSHRGNGTTTASSGSQSTPLISSRLLIETYIDSSQHYYIAALQAETGAPLWKYRAPVTTAGVISAVQVITQNKVVYAAISGHVYALNTQTGKLLWQKDLGLEVSPNTGSIAFDQGMLYIAYVQANSGDGYLYALNARNGSLGWKHSIGYDLAFAVANGVVYYEVSPLSADKPGAVVALRRSDGQTLWSYPTNPISLLLVKNVLYVQSAHQQTASDQGGNKEYKSLLALDVQSGQRLWSQPIVDDGPSTLLFSNDQVILYRTTMQPKAAEFCAYRSSDGSQAWCTSGKQGVWDANTGHGLILDGTLFVSYADGTEFIQSQKNPTQVVQGLNPQTGQALWTAKLAGDASFNQLTGLHGMLYLVSDQNLVALNATNGHTTWQLQADGDILALTTSA